MKATGVTITKIESITFNSLAEHIEQIADPLVRDMLNCRRADWAGMDRCFIDGKIKDLKQSITDMQQVLDDMLPELW